MEEYIRTEHATIIDDCLHLLNEQPIPYNRTRRGIKASLDSWLVAHPTSASSSAPLLAQSHAVFAQDSQYLNPCGPPPSHIKEIVKMHMLEVREVPEDSEEEEEIVSYDIFKVFAMEKKRHEAWGSIAPDIVAAPRTGYRFADFNNSCPQFRYQLNTEDHHLVSKLKEYLMEGKLSLITPAHIFAASSTI